MPHVNHRSKPAMAKTARKRKGGSRRKRGTSTDILRDIALQFPDVEDATTDRGIAFKARGRLLACSAIHKSAEPNSLVIRVSAEQRARLMAAYPDALYLKEHYEKHAAVLARLELLDRESLRDILGAAWLFVTEKAITRKRTSSPRKR
jgi:hypothetical protein